MYVFRNDVNTHWHIMQTLVCTTVGHVHPHTSVCGQVNETANAKAIDVTRWGVIPKSGVLCMDCVRTMIIPDVNCQEYAELRAKTYHTSVEAEKGTIGGY